MWRTGLRGESYANWHFFTHSLRDASVNEQPTKTNPVNEKEGRCAVEILLALTRAIGGAKQYPAEHKRENQVTTYKWTMLLKTAKCNSDLPRAKRENSQFYFRNLSPDVCVQKNCTSNPLSNLMFVHV